MSRLLEEFKGNHGTFFQQKATKDVEKYMDTYLDDNNIVRWKCNNSIPPKELLELWNYTGKMFDYLKTLETDERETKKFFEGYRKAQKNRGYSNEELQEMRSVFGKGQKIIDVITGYEIIL